MLELLLVFGALIVFGVIGFITLVITPQIMILLGLWVLAAGLLIGIPTGLWYHVALYRQLATRMALPSRWWQRPVELHQFLTPGEFRQVQPWFIVGAVGFVLCCVGGVAAIAGLLMMRFYP